MLTGVGMWRFGERLQDHTSRQSWSVGLPLLVAVGSAGRAGSNGEVLVCELGGSLAYRLHYCKFSGYKIRYCLLFTVVFTHSTVGTLDLSGTLSRSDLRLQYSRAALMRFARIDRPAAALKTAQTRAFFQNYFQ